MSEHNNDKPSSQAETNFHLCNAINELQAAVAGLDPHAAHNIQAAIQIAKGVKELQYP